MSKWKCEICGDEFTNFQAQGFDNKIYRPLCYFKKLSADLQVENERLKKQLEESRLNHKQLKDLEKTQLLNSYQAEKLIKLNNQQQEFIKYLEDKIKYFKDLEQFAIKTFNNKAVINLDLVKISMDEDRIVIDNLEEILQNYKEIIGVKNESNIS